MNWDHEVDLLVVGSGNGAMTGAICSHDMGVGSILVVEKGSRFGGTSALSGGGVWAPLIDSCVNNVIVSIQGGTHDATAWFRRGPGSSATSRLEALG